MLSTLHTMSHLILTTLGYVNCCSRFRKEAMVQCLLWGHTASMWWNCDRKPDLTLNPRPLTTTSFYKDVSCIALHFAAYTALPARFKNTFRVHSFITVMGRMCSTEHSTEQPSLSEASA